MHATSDEATLSEGKWIVSELAKLKYELQHNRTLTPIPDDGESDVATYNDELAARGNPQWHNVPWLYSECYLYRYAWRIRAILGCNANSYSKTHLERLQANHEMEAV